VIFAASPGAIVDSSTSNKSTAKRTGAFGSVAGAFAGGAAPGGEEPRGDTPGDPDGVSVAVGADVWSAVAADADAEDVFGSPIGVTVYTPSCAVSLKVTR
jgi:hypothetical protein